MVISNKNQISSKTKFQGIHVSLKKSLESVTSIYDTLKPTLFLHVVWVSTN